MSSLRERGEDVRISVSSSGASMKPSDSDFDLQVTSSPVIIKTTFVPEDERARRIPSLELLVPSPDSGLRKTTIIAATFNMIATIVGGGVLSVPLSFSRAGIIPATMLMMFSAVITEFSLYILCSCARRTGASSYGGVARHAFGPRLELVTTLLLVIYLFFNLIAYQVLVKGTLGPIVAALVTSNGTHATSVMQKFLLSDYGNDFVLFGFLLSISPLLLSRNLYTLRHTCYCGFASISVLCFAIIYRAYQKNVVTNPDIFKTEVLWNAPNPAKVLLSFPIIILAFLSSFNMISVHCALVDPTRDRVRSVIRRAVLWSGILMYVFGLSGYLFAYDETDGNILLNFDATDKVIFLGRVGCGICILFAMPMATVPFREAVISLPRQIRELRESHGRHATAEGASMTPHSSNESGLCDLDEERTRLVGKQGKGKLSYDSTAKKVEILSSPMLNKAPRKENETTGKSTTPGVSENVTHCVTTLCITLICFVGAVIAPGVAIVWDIVGSSVAFLIQFTLPAACYIKLRARRKGHTTVRMLSAWALLIFSLIGAAACTIQTALRMINGLE